ncbi:MAG: glycosyl transferase family 2 [Candidatus Tectomicrobia bacterium]|uniref:Glycosyl transferase family 2 n=1 Tax=Tectimicrobiota bacterium TaxID=2528274 RepID=A0A932GPJ6_UNCTE|nr:glycosyl transferase family 2 [Candidatus Tectomicrobia bacterium]
MARIGAADILIGIPSYNNSKTIAHVVRAVSAGLARHFPSFRAVLVNSDGGSSDGTTDVVRSATLGDPRALLLQSSVNPLEKIITPYHGIPGKGSSFRTIFEIARALQVRACAVVDSDLRSITPEWMELLLRPVLSEGFDYVSPLYMRHKYDGTITNTIVYPLTRALYGKRVRQPIGGDFGFSQKLVDEFLSRNVWETDVARFGIDIWMTTIALATNARVCQSFLGAKIHDAKDPGVHLASMMTQVVGSVFSLMDEFFPYWERVNHSEEVPLFGFPHAVGSEPVDVNIERMIDNFRLGLRELSPLWQTILTPEILQRLTQEGQAPPEKFSIDDELWTQIIYEFALAHHFRVMNRDHLLRSLVPLYLAKIASLVLSTRASSSEEAEDVIEKLALTFQSHKDYLRDRWKEGDSEARRK